MPPEKKKLVILGTGFAAFSLVKKIRTDLYDVTVISPRNHFLFTPLLPSTTVGTIEFRSIIEPIRTAKKGMRFYQGRATHIDLENRIVHCEGAFKRSSFEWPYDYLVVGVGAKSNSFGVPGVEDYAFFLKELKHARAIRQKIIECFERASKPMRPEEDFNWLLNFVVVGGGPTGVEFAAELSDFITQDLHRWFPDLMPHAKITLLEAQDAILTSFDKKLSEYAFSHFKRQKINVQTNSMVKQVMEDGVLLTSGEFIRSELVVWSTGIGPTRFVRKLPFEKDRLSRLVVDDYFRIPGHDNIFAVGDCAVREPDPLAPTAQVAQQVGTYVAKELNRVAKGNEIRPFEYRHMGMMAYVGRRRALADMKNLKSGGWMTWIFWRSAYLTKLVSWKNKTLVFTDWMLAFVFGRDISRF